MSPSELINLLFEMQLTTHVAHLQTSSYAEHMALGAFYEEMVGLSDGVAECIQGNTRSIIRGVGSVEIKEGLDMINYLQQCLSTLMSYYVTVEYHTLKLALDPITSLLNKTIYLLSLK